jgi:hypothetical protein
MAFFFGSLEDFPHLQEGRFSHTKQFFELLISFGKRFGDAAGIHRSEPGVKCQNLG